jgi:hypothetical protein
MPGDSNGGPPAWETAPPSPDWNPENWDCLGPLGAAAIFGTEASRLDWVRNNSSIAFQRAIVALNGRLARRSKDELWGFAPATMELYEDHPLDFPAYKAPPGEYRYELFQEAHRAARRMDSSARIGKMLATVISEMQAFLEANKRTAREVYALGVHGYDGSPEAQAMHVAAVTDQEPRLHIGFGSMHDALAMPFCERITAKLMQIMPTDTFQGIRRVGQIAYNPRFGDQDITFINHLLNEPYFGEPLAADLIHQKGMTLRNFQNKDGRISIARLVHALEPTDLDAIDDINRFRKSEYIRAIIGGYADQTGNLYDAEAICEPYWPRPS